MNIKGGALEFDIIANNGQINSALDETKRRIQGFTDATVEGGEQMEAAFKEIAAQIDAAFRDIDAMAATHSNAISDLKKEYARLGAEAGGIYSKIYGQSGHRTDEQKKIADEIKLRERLLQEIGESADALAEEERAFKKRYEEVQKNAAAQKTFRTQLREVREELAAMELAGETNSEAYAKLQARFGQLSEAMDAVTTQANILKKGERGWEGLISGISGVAGAFSAAQGAVSLFAGENENMQKIMVKIQSLMAITIGLREVQLMLDKDEAFMLVTLRKAKDLYTAAITRMSVALGISNVAAKALMATLTLGLSVAITAVITLVSKYISKTREAKKAQEEFNSKVVETAVEPIAAINELAYAWNKLGNDMNAKNKFIEDNKDRFDDLGFSIRTVKDAEDLLVANKSKFIEACLQRAKALAVQELAVEKYKEVLQAQQELEATPKAYVPKKGTYTDGYGVQRKGVVLEKSSNWQKAEAAVEKAEREYEALVRQQVEFSDKEREILASIGAGSEQIAEGSIAALEKTISALKTKYKEAATDTERTALLKQIQEQEALLKKIDLTATDTDGDKEKDPFTEKLEQRKKKYQEYANWLNSTNEDIRNSAKTEFAGLLADGESYEAYLKNLKRELEALPETADRNKKISVVSNELVSIEKDTYMDGYTKSLEKQISLADTLVEKLAIIADKRKELETDDSGLTKEKGAVLDTEQANIATQAQEDYAKAMRDYNDYLQSKIDAELSYQTRRRELEIAIEKETDAERKKILETQLKTLDTTQQLKQTTDYDALVEEYKTYQQKCADISAQYDEKIALATEQKNEELVAKLQEAKNKALSSAALQELQDSGAWEQLFGNLDDLTTAQIQALIAKIEAQKAQLGVELDPKDLDVVLSKLREAKDEVQTRNPFKALSTALKDYKKDASKANLSEVFKSVGATADLVKGSFDAVTGALSNMGLAGDEVTQQLLGDIGEMIGSAGQLATGIATGNPLGIIQGSIGLISSAFEVFNFRDRRAERAIKKHAAAVEELERVYKALEHAVDKALGESVYDNQKALINNMREQQAHLRAMWQEEEGKKKTDSGKVSQYKEQYEELGRQIEDTIAEITESVTQTSAKDLATQLSDAIAEAYADGFNSDNVKNAIEKVTNQVLGNAVKNALKKQFLEQQLQSAVKQLQRDMGFDEEGGGSFDGLTPEEQQRFKDRVNSIAQGYAEALKLYEDLFKDLDDTGDPTTSLSGAIKGASQESIDLLAGQTNAVRVNQVQQIEVLRQQLIHLANIDGKLSVSNRYLEQIEKNTSGSASDPLRAQGITM
nr:MAG TPA: chromosome segregation ATPase [Caudoviricetes sp.]